MSLLNDTLRRLEARTGRRPDPANTVTAGAPIRSRPRWIRAAGPAVAAVAVALLVALAFQHWLGPASIATPAPATTPATPQPLAAEEPDRELPKAITPAPDATETTAPSAEALSSPLRDEPVRLAESAPESLEAAADEHHEADAAETPPAPASEEPARAGDPTTEETREPETPQAAPEPRDEPPMQDEGVAAKAGDEVARPVAQSETLMEQGRRLQQAGQWQASIGPFEEHLQAEPDDAQARLAIARALRRMDRPAAAVHVLQEGPDAHFGEPEYASALAQAYLESGDPQAARDVLSGVASEDLDATTRAVLARAHQRLGEHAEATRHYRALASRSGEGRHWLGLAHSLEHVGDPGPAREAYRRALDADDLGPASRRHAETRWETLAGHRH